MTRPGPTAFLRQLGETSTTIEMEKDDADGDGDYYAPPTDEEINQLNHGDLLQHPEQYRAVHTYVVVESTLGTKSALPIFAETEHGLIPVVVTRRIANPIEFYSTDDLLTIEIDPERHASLLTGATGGRAPKPECEICWDVLDEVFKIRMPESADWVELDESTDAEYFL